MPTVPLSTGPTVQSTALGAPSGGPRATAASFGGIQAQQLGQLGAAVGTAARVMSDLQEQEDANEVLRAEAALKQNISEQQLGFKSRLGQNAWGVTKEATDSWDKTYDEINTGLRTERQQQMLAQRTANTRLSFFEAMSSHEQGQRKEALESSAKASIKSAIGFAAVNATSPEVVAGERANITKQVAFLAQSNGWTPERREAELTAELTDMHTQVIEELAQQSPTAATEYFKGAKKEIDGTQHAELREFLEKASNIVLAQETADDAVGRRLPEEDAIAAARKKFEGKQEQQVVNEIKARYKENQDAADAAEKDAFDEAWDILAREKRFTAIPASLLQRVSGRQLATLEDEAAGQVTGDPSTEWDRYYDLADMAINNPTEFAKVDLREHYKGLSPQHRERLVSLQSGAGSKTPDYMSAATLQQRIGSAHKQLGFVGKLSDNQQQEKGMFEDEVRAQVEAAQLEKGGKLSGSEQQSIVDGLSREVKLDPTRLGNILTLGFASDERRIFSLTEEDISVAILGDNDADQKTRNDILQFLSEVQGVTEPTNDQINEIYRTHLRSLRGVQ